jgi:hypothetical protein
VAGVKAGREWQPARKVRGAIQLPTAYDQIPETADIASKPFAGTKRQLVDLGEDEHVVAIIAVRAVVDALVKAGSSPIIVCYSMLESVICIEGQTGRKTLLHNQLQGVVFVIEIVPEVTEVLRPTELGVKGPAEILRQGCSSA